MFSATNIIGHEHYEYMHNVTMGETMIFFGRNALTIDDHFVSLSNILTPEAKSIKYYNHLHLCDTCGKSPRNLAPLPPPGHSVQFAC